MDELSIKKRNPALSKLLGSANYSTKIKIFFSTAMAGDDYDPYENNLTFSNLNPKTIKGYVRQISSEALVYKQYGLKEQGAKEILTDAKYKEWFENCSKIEIDGKEYQVYREGAGTRCMITERPFQIIKVVVSRRDSGSEA